MARSLPTWASLLDRAPGTCGPRTHPLTMGTGRHRHRSAGEAVDVEAVVDQDAPAHEPGDDVLARGADVVETRSGGTTTSARRDGVEDLPVSLDDLRLAPALAQLD